MLRRRYDKMESSQRRWERRCHLGLAALVTLMLAGNPLALPGQEPGGAASTSQNSLDRPFRTPNMLGGFFGGYAGGASGLLASDRLVVVANDLDNFGLPPAGSPITITEPGPLGIFSS